MRPIDADALIKDLEYAIAIDEDILGYVGTEGIERTTTQFDKDCKQNAIDLLIHAPTIDAVIVVRCKECKKANNEDCSHSYWDDDWGEWRIDYKGDDWFCADGEREGE